MDLINNYGLFAGNRVYYNHRVNLYSLSGFFVEVHYNLEGNQIENIETVPKDNVLKFYLDRVNLKLD